MKFIAVKTSLPNLFAADVDGVHVGFIQKPDDTETDKNAWRAYRGIGAHARFLGHAWTRAKAEQLVKVAHQLNS